MTKPEAITFKQLRALSAVAACGSITQAAAQIGLTPPAVHTQLRLLEENFDCKLLNRGPGGASKAGATLTLQGDSVLAAAQVIEAALESCAQKVRAFNEGMEGAVVLGVVSTGKYFAPHLVALLKEAFPQVEVVLKIGNRDVIIAALQDGALDLAIMGRPPRRPEVVAVPLGPHPHVLIAPPEHPLAQQDMVLPDALFKEVFLAREEGSGTRILMTRYLDALGYGAPYKMIEMGTNETIKQSVIAGLGIAIISRHTVTEELRSGRLVELKADRLPLLRQWFLIRRADHAPNPATARVEAFIEAQNGAFLPN
ncbi:LysR family transcriptional regulator [Actibacterium atlanticum]|uniref:HTH-type transcriptional regulator CbbR n=1 Tax=Actibacterium atlanticum TaxID=1461693 RepID=A0A058ZQM9_9RHOB|nr:LysR family transcriptional regulator [Actibacterium atlanticum]KCV83858.1 LysR family transcriptional regulator [Actibacterium atlanticum]